MDVKEFLNANLKFDATKRQFELDQTSTIALRSSHVLEIKKEELMDIISHHCYDYLVRIYHPDATIKNRAIPVGFLDHTSYIRVSRTYLGGRFDEHRRNVNPHNNVQSNPFPFFYFFSFLPGARIIVTALGGMTIDDVLSVEIQPAAEKTFKIKKTQFSGSFERVTIADSIESEYKRKCIEMLQLATPHENDFMNMNHSPDRFESDVQDMKVEKNEMATDFIIRPRSEEVMKKIIEDTEQCCLLLYSRLLLIQMATDLSVTRKRPTPDEVAKNTRLSKLLKNNDALFNSKILMPINEDTCRALAIIYCYVMNDKKYGGTSFKEKYITGEVNLAVYKLEYFTNNNEQFLMELINEKRIPDLEIAFKGSPLNDNLRKDWPDLLEKLYPEKDQGKQTKVWFCCHFLKCPSLLHHKEIICWKGICYFSCEQVIKIFIKSITEMHLNSLFKTELAMYDGQSYTQNEKIESKLKKIGYGMFQLLKNYVTTTRRVYTKPIDIVRENQREGARELDIEDFANSDMAPPCIKHGLMKTKLTGEMHYLDKLHIPRFLLQAGFTVDQIHNYIDENISDGRKQSKCKSFIKDGYKEYSTMKCITLQERHIEKPGDGQSFCPYSKMKDNPQAIRSLLLQYTRMDDSKADEVMKLLEFDKPIPIICGRHVLLMTGGQCNAINHPMQFSEEIAKHSFL